MLAIERKNEILDKLRAEQRVLVSDLAAYYHVTEETIRRDLDKLEKEGYATKTYGGAILGNSTKTDLSYTIRNKTNVEAKNQIAAIASRLIEDGDHLMLDDSSTSLYLAKKLKEKKNLTVITNSVELVVELSDVEGCKMIYYLTALINGFFNSVNRMTNVRAGKLFGTANGALINYVEATVLSLLLMLVLKNGKELSWGYIVSVPWWVYLGSICGLLAQLLQIVGTLRSNTLVSSILMLAGNLGMSLTLDYVFYGTFSLLRAAGIFLILAGMALVEKEKTAEAQTAAEEK